jgi:uncharacterized membrane protein
MIALSACVFDTADGADDAVERLTADPHRVRDLVDDVATLRWDEGAARPVSERRPELASQDALGDGFWELVIGLTLSVPLLGAAVGGVAGAGSGSLTEPGIDETFMNRLRDAVTPGRSALLAIGPQSAWELVTAGMTGPERPDPVLTEISDRQFAGLRAVFGA